MIGVSFGYLEKKGVLQKNYANPKSQRRKEDMRKILWGKLKEAEMVLSYSYKVERIQVMLRGKIRKKWEDPIYLYTL